MPILEYHLIEGQYQDAAISDLVIASSELYASVLNSPIGRVRVFVHLHKPAFSAVGGKLVSNDGQAAPYFHFLVLEGRPLSECHALLEGFTGLVVEKLQVPREMVRGGCWPIPAQYWAIGGTPAAVSRAHEIQGRINASVHELQLLSGTPTTSS